MGRLVNGLLLRGYSLFGVLLMEWRMYYAVDDGVINKGL